MRRNKQQNHGHELVGVGTGKVDRHIQQSKGVCFRHSLSEGVDKPRANGERKNNKNQSNGVLNAHGRLDKRGPAFLFWIESGISRWGTVVKTHYVGPVLAD